MFHLKLLGLKHRSDVFHQLTAKFGRRWVEVRVFACYVSLCYLRVCVCVCSSRRTGGASLTHKLWNVPECTALLIPGRHTKVPPSHFTRSPHTHHSKQLRHNTNGKKQRSRYFCFPLCALLVSPRVASVRPTFCLRIYTATPALCRSSCHSEACGAHSVTHF